MLDRRSALKAFAGLFLSAIGMGTAGVAYAGSSPVLTRYALRPARWPEGKRLRIAMLSDLHIGGPFASVASLAPIVDRINALSPDLVLLVGDFVASRARRDSDPKPDEWARVLGSLRGREGVFAVLGNHDWWQDPPTQASRRGPTQAGLALGRAGILVLENEAIRLETGAGPLWLAGLGDQIAFLPIVRGVKRGIDDLPRTLAAIADDGAPAILMAHEPDIFAQVPARIGLTLSGHTHGGQVRLFGYSPVIPSRFGNRYAYGHVREEGRDLIVGAGLGTSKVPFRLGVPPEIVLIDLG